jgi:Zn-dependent peptidase ImmA (M78 family)
MVYWVRDTTKRFRERPYYHSHEIDRECEHLVTDFLRKHKGKLQYPLTTDDLTVLIEQHVRDLDIYADLSGDGADVEGVCRFSVGQKPIIEIAEPLSTNERRANRLRTTLAHELGHAKFHDAVFQMTFSGGDLFSEQHEAKVVCKRDAITDAPQSDWMEWQACYASGAYLMPKSALAGLVDPVIRSHGRLPPFHTDDPSAGALVDTVVDAFDVSSDAARIRLLKLGYLSLTAPAPTLFG